MHTRKQWIMGGLIVLLLILALIGRPALQKDTDTEIRGGSDYIAVIRVDGPIVGGGEIPGLLGAGTVATSEQLMKDVRRATFDPHAKAVLLRINSPGVRPRPRRKSVMKSTACATPASRLLFRWATVAHRADTGLRPKAITSSPIRPR